MAENSSTLESWNWISEVFARENEALTKALQISLSSDSETLSHLPPLPSSTADPESSPAVRTVPNRTAVSRKIAKRKSRASKRTPTTYITADPANFRRMVQEVTGIRIGEGGMPVEPAVLCEPEWTGFAAGQPQSCVATLDTSALLLDRVGPGPAASGCGSFGPVVDSSFFDLESFPSFPTLESWGTM